MPTADMPPSLAPVWNGCIETHEALLECLEEFPADHLHRRSGRTARTPAEIVAHIGYSECVYAMRLILDAPMPPHITYPGARDADVQDAWVPTNRKTSLQVVKLAFDYAADVVSRATEADLERVVADDWVSLGPETKGPRNGLWIVGQMNRHKAHHLGQLRHLVNRLE